MSNNSKILDGLNDALAFAQGDTSRATVRTFEVSDGVAKEVDPTPGARTLEEDLEALLRQDAQNQAKVSRQFTDLRYGPTYESTQPAQTLAWKAADALCAARAKAATLREQLAKVEAERDEALAAISKLQIGVEKLLCAAVGRAWAPAGFSIVSLIDDLVARAKAAEAETARMREATDRALKASIREWSHALHFPVTRMMSRNLRERFGAALSQIQNEGGSRG